MSSSTISKKSRARARKAALKQSQISRAPVAAARRRVTPKPRVINLLDGMKVVHREYIRDVVGSVAFVATSLSVNPGLPTLFPWLSTIAGRFEKYYFRRLKFHFETTSPTSATGTNMFSFDYDASDEVPVSKAVLMSFAGASRSAPWQDLTLDFKSVPNLRFVRTGAVPSSTDVKLYDVANLIIASQGQAGATAIGELYVEYEVELSKPTLESTAPSGEIDSGGTVSKADIFGTLPTTKGPIPASGALNTITFNQPGEFLLVFETTGSGLNGTNLVPSDTSGVLSYTGLGTLINGAATIGLVIATVIVQQGDTIVFDMSAFTTVTSFEVKVASGTYSSYS